LAPNRLSLAQEYLWANLKDVELANLPGATLVEVADQAQRGIRRVCASDELVAGFLAHRGLTLDDRPSTNPRESNNRPLRAALQLRGPLGGLVARTNPDSASGLSASDSDADSPSRSSPSPSPVPPIVWLAARR
jgi:hypothetical protein